MCTYRENVRDVRFGRVTSVLCSMQPAAARAVVRVVKRKRREEEKRSIGTDTRNAEVVVSHHHTHPQAHWKTVLLSVMSACAT